MPIHIIQAHSRFLTLLEIYYEGRIHHSDLLDLITRELDLTSTPFSDTKIITSNDELTPSVNKVGFNLLDDEYFTIPYITDTIPNSSEVNQFLDTTKTISLACVGS